MQYSIDLFILLGEWQVGTNYVGIMGVKQIVDT